ncbi:uncharacterized protein LOC117209540 isoform X3 [Bombus bifarius]|uniref:Uncharacterized protein LOC117209540 isoform X3 n=1 Tax=Bombus bifarius TaxID=103933 RepID=A0A6P8MXS9_9HYME|nr:uncharacterized protein LOC117158376 isoform X4 [Bombus vancouverensis nearcticus]XP_033307572.1 uncharacterized protein LOC117209540 isoform X3 [Bombus bifarius]
MGRAKRNKGRLQDYTQPTASFLPRGSSSIVDRPVDPSCGPSIIAVVHSGFDFRRSSRRLERAERAVRRLPAIQTLGPPSFSSDSSLQICLVACCCKRSFQSPVAARRIVSVWKCIII